MDWETTHPHRKLSGWHLILPPVSPMMWETSHLLTGSTLNSPRDLLLMNQFLWGTSWLFFRSRVHASHPVSLSSSVLPAKSKVAGLPPNKGWWGMSLTHTLSCYLIHHGLYICMPGGFRWPIIPALVPWSRLHSHLLWSNHQCQPCLLYGFTSLFLYSLTHSFNKYLFSTYYVQVLC